MHIHAGTKFETWNRTMEKVGVVKYRKELLGEEYTARFMMIV